MSEPVTTVIVVVLLGLWHLHNRRHPGWRISAEGRFFVLSGYPALIIAIYWLGTAPSDTAWEWVVGNAWTVVAMVSFVYGFNALNAVPGRQRSISHALESLTSEAKLRR